MAGREDDENDAEHAKKVVAKPRSAVGRKQVKSRGGKGAKVVEVPGKRKARGVAALDAPAAPLIVPDIPAFRPEKVVLPRNGGYKMNQLRSKMRSKARHANEHAKGASGLLAEARDGGDAETAMKPTKPMWRGMMWPKHLYDVLDDLRALKLKFVPSVDSRSVR